MGFEIHYQSTDPLDANDFAAMEATCSQLCQPRSWLSCEPVFLYQDQEGFVEGGSKPSF